MGACGSKEDTNGIGSAPVTQRTANQSDKTHKVEETAKTNQTNAESQPSALTATKTEKSVSKPADSSKPEVKMLLLGSGESGKSTILKQIKIIHQNGFSERELYDYKPFVFKNICDCSAVIIKALDKFEMKGDLVETTEEDCEDILNYEVPMDVDPSDLQLSITSQISTLVKEPVVNRLFDEHRGDFYIMDSARYFFENLDRIFAEDYVPEVADVIRTRKQTSGIYDTRFKLEDMTVHLYDVGGQRSERKKWIHCFDNVTAIMFCVALSEYDQVLLESPTQNRLEESLNLFESVVNSMWFRRSSIILCLNKIDVFIEKLPRSPLENYFPDYVGGDDVNKAVKYILWRFKQLNRANINLVPYVTQATDTNNIRLAFAVVKETILHNALMDSGLLKA